MGINAKKFVAAALLIAGAVVNASFTASAAGLPQNDKITVSGIVKSSDNEPLAGAMVYLKGVTTVGSSSSMTDEDGYYTITVPSDAVIVASLLGFTDLEQNVGGRSVVDFVLEVESTFLDDVVVVGYGTQSKLTLTGSVAQTSGRELVKNSGVNISQGLAGRLSGVIVSNRTG